VLHLFVSIKHCCLAINIQNSNNVGILN